MAPLVVAAALEAGIALFSDVWDRRRLVLAGQATLAVSLLFVAWTKSAWGFSIGLAFAGAGSGVGCGAAQALLVTARPSDLDRTMVRWTLFASVGDVLAPVVTAAAIALGFSYRGAMLIVSAVVMVQCVALARVHQGQAPPADSEPAEPLRAALSRAVRNPMLWAWLVAAAMCTLLDELVVALAALRMQREQGVGDALAAIAAMTFSAGAVLGSVLADKTVTRFGWRTVLVASAILCLMALGAFLESHALLSAGIALFIVGVTCAPHHALAQGQAYAAMPRNPGTVQAIGQLFVVVDVLAPLALGIIADRFGLRAAMACLALQPIVIVGLAVSAR